MGGLCPTETKRAVLTEPQKPLLKSWLLETHKLHNERGRSGFRIALFRSPPGIFSNHMIYKGKFPPQSS
jgi:hypothetical protein